MEDKIHEIMNSGEIYDPGLYMSDQFSLIQLVNEFNSTESSLEGLEKRKELIKKMFATSGDNVYIEPPFHASWGGKHIYLGNNIYFNFNATFVDDADIFIGDNTMFGPNVTVVTAAHPLDPEQRKKALQYNKPVHIGKNVWIGANVVVFPGVTIGDNSVIGAGSLVTKDIPANVLAYGSPCRVIKSLTDGDISLKRETENI